MSTSVQIYQNSLRSKQDEPRRVKVSRDERDESRRAKTSRGESCKRRMEEKKKNETQRNNLNNSHEHRRAYTPEFKILTFGKVRAWG